MDSGKHPQVVLGSFEGFSPGRVRTDAIYERTSPDD